MSAAQRNKVLVVGIYLSDKENHAVAISDALSSAGAWQVDLRWGAVGDSAPPDPLKSSTRMVSTQRIAKFEFLNRLLAEVDLDDYEYLLVTDDDIEFPSGFLDAYLEIVARHGFHLAQPARTHRSYIDHYFVAQLMGVEARRTRFVEIGPLFSLHRDLFPLLLPFDERAPMGWGLDFVWPKQIEDAGLTLGIVDQTPVTHALRKPVEFYDYGDTNARMQEFLEQCPHLTAEERFVALQTWPTSPLKADR